MSNSILKKLTIEHLRGCVKPFTLHFDKGKKLTVIYGENGSGKTTICDGLEFLGKGTIGSLDNRGLGKTNKYWYTVGKKASDVLVTLETGDATCTGKIGKSDVIILPAEARPRAEVLRRSQILSLVEAKPGERYTAISRFIDVSGVEDSEAALRELILNLNRNRETAVAVVQENQGTISQFWESAGKVGKDPFTWAERELLRDVSIFAIELQAIGKLRLAYSKLVDYPSKYIETIEKQKAAQEAATEAAKKLNEQLGNVAEGAGEIVSILDAATPYFEKHPQVDQCPLCESTEKVSGLHQRVVKRLSQFTSLQTAKNEQLKTAKTLETAQQKIAELQSDLSRDSKAFETVRAAYQWGDDIPMPKEKCPDKIDSFHGWFEATKELPESWIKSESARQSKSQFYSTLKKAFDTYVTNVQAQKDLDTLIPRLERALKIVQDERRKFTDGVLMTISEEVGRLYEVVHPGEGLNKISMALDPGKRASLELGAVFCGQSDAPPQAYFSQSHLDTLGLCVFLALAARDKPEQTILVLDDVLASVDEPHVERLIEMLYAEVMRFRHCIITTHYRPWKVKLRWGWLQHGQCHFVELAKWTTASGLTMIRSIPDIERLRQLLKETPPDPQLVSAKAGFILEAGLDFLTQLYECSVPRRSNGVYSLGDLLHAINKKLRDALKVELLIQTQNKMKRRCCLTH